MNNTKIIRALSGIDDELIESAAPKKKEVQKNYISWIKWAIPVAACLVLTTAIVIPIINNNVNGDNNISTPEVMFNQSWASFYRNITELEKESDFIGIIEIVNEQKYDEITPDGVDIANESAYTIPTTTFLAKVIDGIRYDNDLIEIFMTGRRGHVVVADDPLMQVVDIWFIFAKLNDDGTYSILGGPQGRFIYDNEYDTITSLTYIESEYTRVELERDFGIIMVDLNLTEVKDEILNNLLR